MGRSVVYLDGAGNPGAEPLRAAPADIAAAWLRVSRRIPPTFAVGVALHETGYATNELDTEVSGKQTGGVFQLDVSGITDAVRAGFPELSPYDLDGACQIFAVRCERDLLPPLLAAFGGDEASFWARGGAGYLAWAHNAGLYDNVHDDGTKSTGPLSSIQRSGLDWTAFRQRNDGTAYGDRIGPYGSDAISGGPDWRDEYANPFDATGAAIPAPLVSASTAASLRLGLVALLALLLLVAALRGPLKVSL